MRALLRQCNTLRADPDGISNQGENIRMIIIVRARNLCEKEYRVRLSLYRTNALPLPLISGGPRWIPIRIISKFN